MLNETFPAKANWFCEKYGRIRRTHPKETDFSRITQHEIIELLLNFNQVPRKALYFNTLFEIFMSYLPH